MVHPSRTIVVTGATRGLGRAMIRAFHRAGHRVFGCGRSKEDVVALNRELDPSSELPIVTAVNVTSDSEVGAWAAEILRKAGAPDLLLNNAARINRSAPLWTLTAEEFDSVIDVNLKGIANTIRHFVPAMIDGGRGVVVNFSSGWGRSTSPEVAAYCATKWGVEGLSRSLAQELPSPLASIALNPGMIHTDMLESCFAEGASSYPKPEAWAERAIPFLLGLGPKENGSSLDIG